MFFYQCFPSSVRILWEKSHFFISQRFAFFSFLPSKSKSVFLTKHSSPSRVSRKNREGYFLLNSLEMLHISNFPECIHLVTNLFERIDALDRWFDCMLYHCSTCVWSILNSLLSKFIFLSNLHVDDLRNRQMGQIHGSGLSY